MHTESHSGSEIQSKNKQCWQSNIHASLKEERTSKDINIFCSRQHWINTRQNCNNTHLHSV